MLKQRTAIVLLLVCLAAQTGRVSARNAAPQVPTVSAASQQTIQFNRDIRPILSENCFTCHGPDQAHRVTKFRFDVEESAKQDLGGGRAAVVPGDPSRSLLMQRITATEPRRRMPPESTGHRLTDREIGLLRTWIEEGAGWAKHWSFMPPVRPEPPAVQSPAWPRNPIDRFVLARLEHERLQPSHDVDRGTLLRRVTLDLAGRGPTVQELDAFLADRSPNAYDKVVDRLLASHEYGERMALPWLDAARYADTDGYYTDGERTMWRWRDWVIDAFNANMPYDQFTIEQLAGDLLPNPTLEQRIATAFNRNHRVNSEAGVIAAEYRTEYVADRVATTSTVFLGLTFGSCARCHDHKYDPFTQEEFYRLYAYFNNIPELGTGDRGNTRPRIKAPLPAQQAELARLDENVKRAAAALATLEPKIVAAEDAWLETLAAGTPQEWVPPGVMAHYPLDRSLQGAINVAPSRPQPPSSAMVETSTLEHRRKDSPSTLQKPFWEGAERYDEGVHGQAARFDGTNAIDAGDVGEFRNPRKFTLGAWIFPTAPTGAILTKTIDRPLEKGYLFQLKDGKLQLSTASFQGLFSAIYVESTRPITLNQWHYVMATYGGSEAPSVAIYVDGEPQPLSVLVDTGGNASADEPFRIGGGGGLENRFRGLIDDVRLYNAELSPEEAAIMAVSRSVTELAAVPRAKRNAAEASKLRRAFFDSEAASATVRAAVSTLRALSEERAKYYDSIQTVAVMEEIPTPRETHVLIRGAYNSPGKFVTPGVPAMLPPMRSEYPTNRLGLARWLVDGRNPLTARVAMNRFWQMYFGTGLVKTLDDFGSQGEPPSHPELLDWLATEFVRTGWDVKAMQRLIVTSATYRQASGVTPALLQRDPDNRLLARGPRYRLPAEMVRDQALGMAGLIVQRVGGPSVKPYQPAGLWDGIGANGDAVVDAYVQDHGDNLYRRSLYTYWKRTVPPPALSNFDAPTHDLAIMQRGVTNSPLQALTLMNDVTYLEAARMIAERMIKEGGGAPERRIAFAYRLATGRQPNDNERLLLMTSLQRAVDRFASDQDAAEKFVSAGEHRRDPAINVTELAAYSSVASVILNLDTTITKE